MIVLEVGGGFAGLTMLLMEHPWRANIPLNMRIFSALFGILYIFGIVAGLTLVEWSRLGIRLSLIYQALQIPVISSPLITYELFSGLQIGLGCREDKFFILCQVGSRIVLYVMRKNLWGIGINVLALALFVYLLLQIRPKTKDVELHSTSTNSPGTN